MKVIWWDQCRGNWDHGLLMSIFSKHPDKFQQHNSKEQLLVDKAIIIVSGKPEIGPLRNYLDRIGGGTVILVSEEDGFFEWKKAIPQDGRFEIWTQYWWPNTKRDITHRILEGPPSRLEKYQINRHLPKKYLWSFIGQVQNPLREQCVNVLKEFLQGESKMANGFLQTVQYFGGEGENGMVYQQYLDILCQSKYVLCPAGSMCVESFRVYEAMECGAIPITNARAPRDPVGFNWWNEVYPEHNLITVDQWDAFELSYLMDEDMHSVLHIADNAWWDEYKIRLENKLLDAAS